MCAFNIRRDPLTRGNKERQCFIEILSNPESVVDMKARVEQSCSAKIVEAEITKKRLSLDNSRLFLAIADYRS